MSPDDYTSDPSPKASGVPGTDDDVPASYGEDLPEGSDATVPERGPVEEGGGSDLPAGRDESELWRQQKALIEEDEQAGLKLDGFPEEEVADILDAMGDDAADPLDDSPNGTSATGLWSGPDHGGFPERSE